MAAPFLMQIPNWRPPPNTPPIKVHRGAEAVFAANSNRNLQIGGVTVNQNGGGLFEPPPGGVIGGAKTNWRC